MPVTIGLTSLSLILFPTSPLPSPSSSSAPSSYSTFYLLSVTTSISAVIDTFGIYLSVALSTLKLSFEAKTSILRTACLLTC